MEYTPEELKKAFKLYYDLRVSNGNLKILYYHSPLKKSIIESARNALSSFRECVPSSIVDLFSDELGEIERKIESACKPSPFVHKIIPDKKGKRIMTSPE